MDTLNIFFLILAGVFLLWQIGIGITAMLVIAKGGRITTIGIGPGALFLIFLALGLFL